MDFFDPFNPPRERKQPKPVKTPEFKQHEEERENLYRATGVEFDKDADGRVFPKATETNLSLGIRPPKLTEDGRVDLDSRREADDYVQNIPRTAEQIAAAKEKRSQVSEQLRGQRAHLENWDAGHGAKKFKRQIQNPDFGEVEGAPIYIDEEGVEFEGVTDSDSIKSLLETRQQIADEYTRYERGLNDIDVEIGNLHTAREQWLDQQRKATGVRSAQPEQEQTGTPAEAARPEIGSNEWYQAIEAHGGVVGGGRGKLPSPFEPQDGTVVGPNDPIPQGDPNFHRIVEGQGDGVTAKVTDESQLSQRNFDEVEAESLGYKIEPDGTMTRATVVEGQPEAVVEQTKPKFLMQDRVDRMQQAGAKPFDIARILSENEKGLKKFLDRPNLREEHRAFNESQLQQNAAYLSTFMDQLSEKERKDIDPGLWDRALDFAQSAPAGAASFGYSGVSAISRAADIGSQWLDNTFFGDSYAQGEGMFPEIARLAQELSQDSNRAYGVGEVASQRIENQISGAIGQIFAQVAISSIGGVAAKSPKITKYVSEAVVKHLPALVASGAPIFNEAITDAERTMMVPFDEMTEEQRSKTTKSAVISTAINTAIDRLGLEVVAGKVIRGADAVPTDEVVKRLTSGKIFKDFLVGFVGEGSTEATQEYVSDSVAKFFYDADRELWDEEAVIDRFKAFVIGGVAGGVAKPSMDIIIDHSRLQYLNMQEDQQKEVSENLKEIILNDQAAQEVAQELGPVDFENLTEEQLAEAVAAKRKEMGTDKETIEAVRNSVDEILNTPPSPESGFQPFKVTYEAVDTDTENPSKEPIKRETTVWAENWEDAVQILNDQGITDNVTIESAPEPQGELEIIQTTVFADKDGNEVTIEGIPTEAVKKLPKDFKSVSMKSGEPVERPKQPQGEETTNDESKLDPTDSDNPPASDTAGSDGDTTGKGVEGAESEAELTDSDGFIRTKLYADGSEAANRDAELFIEQILGLPEGTVIVSDPERTGTAKKFEVVKVGNEVWLQEPKTERILWKPGLNRGTFSDLQGASILPSKKPKLGNIDTGTKPQVELTDSERKEVRRSLGASFTGRDMVVTAKQYESANVGGSLEMMIQGQGREVVKSKGLTYKDLVDSGILESTPEGEGYRIRVAREQTQTPMVSNDTTQTSQRGARRSGTGDGEAPKGGQPSVPTSLSSSTRLDLEQWGSGRVEELPVGPIVVNKDVPQFKADTNPVSGVGKKLPGKYERTPYNPIVVWEKLSGEMEVVTGRHRLDLARRTGEKTIPSQIVSEADGFTRDHAIILDAEANIRDNQGEVKDYAYYFKNAKGVTEEYAIEKGLLRGGSKGYSGWHLGKNASDDLWDSYANDQINEQKAVAIAKGAPNNAAAQRLAMEGWKGKSAGELELLARQYSQFEGLNQAADQAELFENDATFQRMKAEAQVIAKVQWQQIQEATDQIKVVKNAARNPQAARKLGVKVNNPESVREKVQELEERVRLLKKPDAETRNQLRIDAGLKPTQQVESEPETPPENPNQDSLFGDDDTFNLASDTASDGDLDLQAERDRQEAEAEAEANQTQMFDGEEAKPAPKPDADKFLDDLVDLEDGLDEMEMGDNVRGYLVSPDKSKPLSRQEIEEFDNLADKNDAGKPMSREENARFKELEDRLVESQKPGATKDREAYNLAEVVEDIRAGRTNTPLKAINEAVADAMQHREDVKRRSDARKGDRQRGKLAILDNITRAAKQEKISKESAKVLTSFVNSLEDRFIDDVAISLRARGRAQGTYDFADSLVTLFRNANNLEKTGIHEFWHSLSRLIPESEVKKMASDYSKSLFEYLKKDPLFYAFVGRYTLTPSQYDEISRFTPKSELDNRLTPTYDDKGEINGYRINFSEENYRFHSLDEWIAEKMTDETLKRGDGLEPNTVFAKIAVSLRRFLRLVKRHLGMDPYNNFLKAVFKKPETLGFTRFGPVASATPLYDPRSNQSSSVRSAVETFNRPFPKDKRAAFMGVIEKLADAGINTPEALVEGLQRRGSKKLRPYIQTIWNGLAMFDATAAQTPSPDWGAVYSGLANAQAQESPQNAPQTPQPAKAAQGTEATENATPAVEEAQRAAEIDPKRLTKSDVTKFVSLPDGTQGFVTSVKGSQVKLLVDGEQRTVDQAETPLERVTPRVRSNVAGGSALASGGNISIDEFVPDESVHTGEEMKLFEASKNLIKKHGGGKRIMEGRNPKGTLGISYGNTGNIAIASLNNIGVAAHETAHNVDRDIGLTLKTMIKVGTSSNGNPKYDPATAKERRQLTDVYVEYYPGGKRTHPLHTRMVEGFATFIQKSIENPKAMRARFPELTAMFLSRDGKYYSEKTMALFRDAREIVNAYNRLDPLQKIGARKTNSRTKQQNKWLSIGDKVQTFVFDRIWPVEKAAKIAGVDMSAVDPSVFMREYERTSRVFAHNVQNNVFGKQSYWALRDGEYREVLDFNWSTLLHDLNRANLEDRFDDYLIARRTVSDFKKLDDLKAEMERVNTEMEAFENEKDIPDTLVEEMKGLVDSHRRLDGILTKNKIGRKTAEEAVELGLASIPGVQRFEQMFDTLVRGDLDSLKESGILSAEDHARYVKEDGYATFKRDYYDDLVDPETGMSAVSNVTGKAVSSLKSRTGSEKAIISPLFASIANHNEVLHKSMRQVVYNKMAELADAHQDTMGQIMQREPLDVSFNPATGQATYPQESDPNIIMARRNGKRMPYVMNSALKATLDATLMPESYGIAAKILSIGAQAFTKGTTSLYAAFAAMNTTVDQVTASAQSRTGYIPVVSQAKLIYRAIKTDDSKEAHYFREYMILAGATQTLTGFHELPPDKAKKYVAREARVLSQIAKRIQAGEGLKSFLAKAQDRANKAGRIIKAAPGAPSQASEIFTRATEYVNARTQGQHQMVALEMAGRVSAPFHHRGMWGIGPRTSHVGTVWLKSLPYQNAALQVMKEYSKAMTDKKRMPRALTVTALLLSAKVAELIPFMLMATDEQEEKYKDLEADYLARYLFVPHPNGIDLWRFRVPENMTAFAMPINMALQNHMMGNNFDAIDSKNAAMAWVPDSMDVTEPTKMFFGLTPQLMKPTMQVTMNKRIWPSVRDLEPPWMDGLLPEDRMFSTTSDPAKWIGDQMGLSPIKVDHFLQETFGRSVKMLTKPKSEFEKQMQPFLQRYYFTAGRNVQDFYEQAEKTEQLLGSIKSLKSKVDDKHKDQLVRDKQIVDETESLLKEYRAISDDEIESSPAALQLRKDILDSMHRLSVNPLTSPTGEGPKRVKPPKEDEPESKPKPKPTASKAPSRAPESRSLAARLPQPEIAEPELPTLRRRRNLLPSPFTAA